MFPKLNNHTHAHKYNHVTIINDKTWRDIYDGDIAGQYDYQYFDKRKINLIWHSLSTLQKNTLIIWNTFCAICIEYWINGQKWNEIS